MGLFSTESTQDEALKRLTRERDEARTLASRLRADLDDLSQQAAVARQAQFSSERAKSSLQDSVDVLRQSRKQLEDRLNLTRADLGRSKSLLATRDATIVEQELTIAELRSTLASREAEIERLKSERVHDPVSDAVLLLGYQRQREVLDNLIATLSCPICFEPLGKASNVISLVCGHSFCGSCVQHWAQRAAAATGEIACPECRGDARKTGITKIYMLEEAVRVLARLDLDDLMSAPAMTSDATPVDATVSPPPDEDAARLLRPRTPSRYAGHATIE